MKTIKKKRCGRGACFSGGDSRRAVTRFRNPMHFIRDFGAKDDFYKLHILQELAVGLLERGGAALRLHTKEELCSVRA